MIDVHELISIAEEFYEFATSDAECHALLNKDAELLFSNSATVRSSNKLEVLLI